MVYGFAGMKNSRSRVCVFPPGLIRPSGHLKPQASFWKRAFESTSTSLAEEMSVKLATIETQLDLEGPEHGAATWTFPVGDAREISATIDGGDAPVFQGEKVPVVQVRVEETVHDGLAKEGPHQDRAKGSAILAGRDQRLAIVELDPIEPFKREHTPRGPAPIDLRDIIVRLGHHVLAKFGSRCCLPLKVQLARGPLAELGDHEARTQALELTTHPLGMRRCPLIGLDGLRELVFDPGAEHFDCDLSSFGRHGAMDLRDRSGADGHLVELGIEALERRVEGCLDRVLDQREWCGGQVVLQLGQVLSGFLSNKVGSRRKCLPKLDCGWADCHERGRIIGSRRDSRSEPRKLRQSAHRRRSQRIFLDSAQRTVACQRAAPLQQTPQMRD